MNEGVYGPFSCKLLGNSISAPSVHKVSRTSRFNPIHTLLKHQVAFLCSIGKWVTCHVLQKQGQSCIIEDYIWFLVFSYTAEARCRKDKNVIFCLHSSWYWTSAIWERERSSNPENENGTTKQSRRLCKSLAIDKCTETGELAVVLHMWE